MRRRRKTEREKEENIWQRKRFSVGEKTRDGKGGRYLEEEIFRGGKYSEEENKEKRMRRRRKIFGKG